MISISKIMVPLQFPDFLLYVDKFGRLLGTQVKNLLWWLSIANFLCGQAFSIFPFLPQEIDFAGFKIFMDIFLEVATPEDLCKHLFLSFVRVPQTANIDGKILKVFMFSKFANLFCKVSCKIGLAKDLLRYGQNAHIYLHIY